MIVLHFKNIDMKKWHRRVGVEVERSPRMREIGVRSSVATDQGRTNKNIELVKFFLHVS